MRRMALVLLACAIASAACAEAADAPAGTQEILADAPTELSVTIYRSPYRNSGGMQLDQLHGFALIRETRLVNLPAGLSRVRFEGVTDGIEPVSAIASGLQHGVIEKNLDNQLLSPAALVAAAAGKSVVLVRANRVTGKSEQIHGVIVSGAQADGIVFQSQEGTEALRCSGLAETFSFATAQGLSSSPTLSVLVRETQATIERIQLSYLAYGFDWAADYTATLSKEGNAIDLGAWVTLANGNGTSFPQAHTQVVAGRLNREAASNSPNDDSGPIFARCWPRGSTSDQVEPVFISRAVPLGFQDLSSVRLDMPMAAAAMRMADMQEVTVTGSRVRQEQLGDLKLYRVPEPTTVASRQSKQVRLLDREGIPVSRVYTARLYDRPGPANWNSASIQLRTRNDAANHLGVPLPSGRVAVLTERQGAQLLLNRGDMRDHAVNEDVEIEMGHSSDVNVRTRLLKEDIDPARVRTVPLVPGVAGLRISDVNDAIQVEISNARDEPIDFEFQFDLSASQVIRSDHALGTRHGQPTMRIRVPANSTVTASYQTGHTRNRTVRPQ